MLPEAFTLKDLTQISQNGNFTRDFSISLKSDSGDCMIVTALARYEGEKEPVIQFTLTSSVSPEKPVYQSHLYTVGRQGEWTRQQWRVPPMFHPSIWAKVEVFIPEGTVLTLSDFHNDYAFGAKPWPESGPRHNAHLGFWGIAPSNSRRAIELAAQCGFSSCIVNVKETRDGHVVCYHDPTINKLATDKDGNRIQDNPAIPPLDIASMTLAELREWDLGSYRHPLYSDFRILLMEDAFRIMAKTGLHPMFSTHPAPTVETWLKVKDMLLRYGLTKKFHVKAFRLEILERAYSIFGDTINGYTWDNGNVEDFKKSKLYGANCRLGIELTKKNMTREIAREIIDAGFFAAVFGLKERVHYREFEELMEWGVTEFTEDHHCSMGLNW